MTRTRARKLIRPITAACVFTLIIACAPPSDPKGLAATGPLGAEPGTCWDKTETPAVIETRRERVLISPAQISTDGKIQVPAQYQIEARPQIIQPRQENWYQIMCSADMTQTLVANLQRAPRARGFYAGPATGKLDRATRAALADFQTTQGLTGAVLTVAAAQQLGLVPIART
ncbi:hypothetical protein ROLI_008360 [Roseobacter fucihabitans]|uniref:Peptidoglycan binding-like domain-containing protein n=1 Tax=Roseobacter fucihabitans TaxID=1537242 RepID=A0ABZ2BP32_9RHOB|nr:peptidoglycan-binding domain-containing protein [Roseobacter litoralis]MBC6965996.1 hypothetical protein [Roseobacter litoralis]